MKIKFRLLVFIACALVSLITFKSSFANDKIDTVTVEMEKGDNLFKIFLKMKINQSESKIFIKSLDRRLDLRRIPIGQKINFYFKDNTKKLLVISVPLKRNITVLAWREKNRINSARIPNSMALERIKAVFNMENFRPQPGKYIVKVKKGDNLTKILSYYGANLNEVHNIIIAFSSVKNLKKLRPDDEITMYYSSGEDGVYLNKLELIMSGEKILVKKDAFKIFRVISEQMDTKEEEEIKLVNELNLSSGDIILGQLIDAGWTKKEAREAVNAFATVYDPKKIIKIESKLIFPKDLRIRAFAFVVSKNSSILVTSIGSGKFLARRELLQEAKALLSNLKYGEILEDTIDENLILQDPIVTKSSIEKKVDKDINKIEVSDQIEDVDDFYLPANLVEGKIIKGDSLLSRLFALGEKRSTIKKAIKSLSNVTDPNFVRSGSDFIVALGKDKQPMRGFYVGFSKNKGYLVSLSGDNNFISSKITKTKAITLLSKMKREIDILDKKEEIKWVKKSFLDGNDYKILSFNLKNGETLSHIFSKVGISEKNSINFVQELKTIYNPKNLHIGQKVKLVLENEDSTTLLGLIISLDKIRSIEIFNIENTYQVNRHEQKTFTKYHKNFGEINTSLYKAAKEVGMPISVLMQLVKVFSWDVDFQREVQTGDAFEVLYQRKYILQDEAVDSGTVVRAALILGGERLTLYRFEDKYNGLSDYFDSEGHSVKKALMRTPLDGARLTSGFGKRKHPILGYTKMHRGVDFGAQRNTPVYAAGDGIIEYLGRNGGYGNYILIRHNSDYKTAYAHLSRFAKFLKKRKRVKQGDIIGYVGSTGRSTGPHLHYEIIFRGKQVNPVTVRLPQGIRLQGKLYQRFSKKREALDKVWNGL